MTPTGVTPTGVTRAAGPGWIAAPDKPSMAAPLRAVDLWRAERSGDELRMTVRVGVRGDDPNLRGHYPGLAVFPGVFVIEALCQAMSLAMPENVAVLRSVRSVRFLAPLLDGDELTLEVTASPRAGGGWEVAAKGLRADGTLSARLRATFAPGEAVNTAPPLLVRQPVREHADIRAILPQRHPLLLVDRVLDLDPGRFIRTIKAITGTEPCYAGLADHAESWRYDYPYSLMIESLGQSAALLWLHEHVAVPGDDTVLMFVGARNFSFEATAHPGDVLRHEVRLDAVVADTAFASGETWIGDRRVATVATLIATRRPVRPSRPVLPAALAGGASVNSTDGVVSQGKGSR